MTALTLVRRLRLTALAIALGLASLLSPLAVQAQQTLTRVRAVAAVSMTVSDLERSVEFYSKVLSFEKVSEFEAWGEDHERLQGIFGLRTRTARMRLGEESIELTEYLTPKGRPIPIDSRSNDRWFQHIAIIVPDMERAYQVLRRNSVEHASPAPQKLPEWNKAAGGIQAFYFKDPDGHPLEILEFPPDKGDPKWQRVTSELFLGIDHTAIVVGNTESSLTFYRDLVGMKVVGESENYGPEQERLNNVFGARLRITTLRAPRGPGVELLEYLSPRDGKPMPLDVRPNDLIHWQTTILVQDADEFARRALSGKHQFVSSRVIHLGGGDSDTEKSFLVRDPDGHAVQLLEKSTRGGQPSATNDALSSR